MNKKFAAIAVPASVGIALAFTLIRPSLFAQDQATTIQASAPVPTTISPDVPQTRDEIRQWRGQFGDEKAHEEVITTSGDWSKLWKHLGLPSHFDMNDKTQMAVCVYLGQRNTTGFKPYIVSAIERDGKLVVTYSAGKPASDALVNPEVTHPWVAAIIRKSELPVVFKEI